jgi:hypothetical protein
MKHVLETPARRREGKECELYEFAEPAGSTRKMAEKGNRSSPLFIYKDGHQPSLLTAPYSNRNEFSVLIRGYVLMILPQVHLRKPCYDFYFL